ncbi:MAG TPA: hypothetical protein VFC34_03650 [Puia sp.]|nr:hypothetical protein [Puia sp.]
MKKILLIAAAAIFMLCSYVNSASQTTTTVPSHFATITIKDTVPGQPSDTSKMPMPMPDTSKMPKASFEGSHQ